MTKRTFILAHAEARRRAIQAVQEAPDGYSVVVSEPKRTAGQNEKFHAICGDVAKSDAMWGGKRRSLAQWKVLFVSGHAVATKEGSEMVPGLEGEFINLRESTAAMSKKRGSSLIEYATAYCVVNGIKIFYKELA